MEKAKPSDIESFGAWIYKRRRALNLTRDELAEKVGCAAVTIKKIERDERKPSPQIAALLAEQLVVPRADRERFLRPACEFPHQTGFPAASVAQEEQGRGIPGQGLPEAGLETREFLLTFHKTGMNRL